MHMHMHMHMHVHGHMHAHAHAHAHAAHAHAGAAALTGALSAAAPSFSLLVLARAAQAACWALAQAAATTWYAEFLPSHGRGPLLAAVSVGWPVGRALVITASALLGWRPLVACQARPLGMQCHRWLVCFASLGLRRLTLGGGRTLQGRPCRAEGNGGQGTGSTRLS